MSVGTSQRIVFHNCFYSQAVTKNFFILSRFIQTIQYNRHTCALPVHVMILAWIIKSCMTWDCASQFFHKLHDGELTRNPATVLHSLLCLSAAHPVQCRDQLQSIPWCTSHCHLTYVPQLDSQHCLHCGHHCCQWGWGWTTCVCNSYHTSSPR